MIIRILLLALFYVASLRAEVPAEAKSCFEWFGTLGFPDAKDARWAEVWSGHYFSQGGESKPEVLTFRGYVLEDTNDRFRVMPLDMLPGWLKRSKPDAAVHERVDFEERPFLEMAEGYLEKLRHPPKQFDRFGNKLSQRAEVFALAYVCWRKGKEALSQQLFDEAAKVPTYSRTPDGKERSVNMRESLEIEFGHQAMWDAVLRMGGGTLGENSWGGGGPLQPRAELLESFRRIVKLFPRCEHMDRAKSTIATLERMVAEDEKHPPMTQEQIEAMPLDKRIAELIWLLRDQNGHQMSQPGWCDVLGYAADGKSAGHQLIDIGYPAASALIEALTDERFSRSVGFHRDFHFSHTILTIGDCAQQILRRITSQDFYSPASTSGYMSNEEKMLAVQKAARVWWADYQKKGLKQMLVDSISEGKTSPHALVEQLKAADPTAVEPAILAGAAKASTDWQVRQFIGELDSIKSPQCTAALVGLMQNHGNIEVRLDAAARLLNREDPGALPVLLHEWSVYQSSKQSFDDPFETMADMLACHGSDRAVQALISGWETRNAGQRLKIVEKIGECMAQKPRTHSFDSPAVPRKPEDAALTRALALLVRALEDTTTNYGLSGGSRDLVYGEASIGDFALHSLHELDPDKFTFTPEAGRRQRNTERIAAANLWRKEHSQPLLPTPPPPGPKLPVADALKIVRVTIQGDPLPENNEIAKKLRALENTRFSAKMFPELLVWFAQIRPPGVTGLDLEASRESDLTGVEIVARVETGQTKSENDLEWSTRHSGHCGKQHLGNSSGGSSHSYVIKADYWDVFTEATAKALEQPPETDFIFKAALSQQ